MTPNQASKLDRNGWRRLILYSSGLGLIGRVFSFGALTLLAFLMTAHEFGQFSVVQIIVNGAAGVISSSYGLAANRGVAAAVSEVGDLRYQDAIALALRGLLGYILWAGLAMFVLILALYYVVMGFQLDIWVVPIAVASVSIVVADVVLGALSGLGKVEAAALLGGLRAAVSGATALLLGYWLGPIGASWGLIVFDIVIVLVVVILLAKRPQISLQSISKFKEEFLTIIAGVAATFIAQIAGWVLLGAIQGTMGLAVVGAYAVASRFAALVLIVPGFLSQNILGELNRVLSSRQFDAYRQIVFRYIIGVLLGTIVLSAIAWVAVLVGFQEAMSEYENLAETVLVLSLGSALRASATANGMVLVSLGARRVWVLSDAVSTVVSIAWIVVCLVMSASFMALIISMVVSAGVCLAIRLVSTRKQLSQLGAAAGEAG